LLYATLYIFYFSVAICIHCLVFWNMTNTYNSLNMHDHHRKNIS